MLFNLSQGTDAVCNYLGQPICSTLSKIGSEIISGPIPIALAAIAAIGTAFLVYRKWNAVAAVTQISTKPAVLPLVPFGKAEWEKYIGIVGEEPPLPSDIEEILNDPCPFWPNKKVHETHVLCLIPQTVNGKPLNLKSLGELVQKPLQGHATKYPKIQHW